MSAARVIVSRASPVLGRVHLGLIDYSNLMRFFFLKLLPVCLRSMLKTLTGLYKTWGRGGGGRDTCIIQIASEKQELFQRITEESKEASFSGDVGARVPTSFVCGVLRD